MIQIARTKQCNCRALWTLPKCTIRLVTKWPITWWCFYCYRSGGQKLATCWARCVWRGASHQPIGTWAERCRECFFADQETFGKKHLSICQNAKRPFWTQDFDDEQPLTTGGWKNFCALFRGDDLGQPLAPSRRSSRCCYLVEIDVHIFYCPIFFCHAVSGEICRMQKSRLGQEKTEHLPPITVSLYDNHCRQGFCCFFTGIESTSEVEVSFKKSINLICKAKATCLNRSLSCTGS